MTLCSSGNLSICATAGTNRSISTEVGTASGSLSALSVSAGKSAPHCMREFYGYSSMSITASPATINFFVIDIARCSTITTTPTSGTWWICPLMPTWVSAGELTSTVICIRADKNLGPPRQGSVFVVHDSSSSVSCEILITQEGG